MLASTTGSFYLANHSVAPELSSKVRRAAETFFALPADAKLALHFEKTGQAAGLHPPPSRKLGPVRTLPGDQKEALDFTFSIPPKGVSDPVAHRMYGGESVA